MIRLYELVGRVLWIKSMLHVFEAFISYTFVAFGFMVELFPLGVWGFQWGSAGKGSAGKNPLSMSLFDALFLGKMLLEVIFLRRFLQRSLVSKWSAENEGFIETSTEFQLSSRCVGCFVMQLFGQQWC